MAAEFDFGSTVEVLHEAIIGGDAETVESSVQSCIDNEISPSKFCEPSQAWSSSR